MQLNTQVVQTFFELGYLENGDIMRSIVPFNRQADLRKKKMFPTFHYSMSMVSNTIYSSLCRTCGDNRFGKSFALG